MPVTLRVYVALANDLLEVWSRDSKEHHWHPNKAYLDAQSYPIDNVGRCTSNSGSSLQDRP